MYLSAVSFHGTGDSGIHHPWRPDGNRMPSGVSSGILAGVAEEDMAKGTELKVHGHHHAIDGLVPELLEVKEAGNAAPFYLLNNTTLLRDVKKGQPITLEDVDLSGLEIYKLYQDGLKLS